MTDRTGKHYDPERDLWFGDDGHAYIRNDFREGDPVWIDVTGDVWTADYAGVAHALNWPQNLDSEFLIAARRVIGATLRRMAPSALQTYNTLLRNLAFIHDQIDGPAISKVLADVEAVAQIWNILKPHDRIGFRTLYRRFADLTARFESCHWRGEGLT